MFLSTHPGGPGPIYQRIRDRIVEAIAGGRQPAGSGLPSTRQLAVDLGVNFHTVNKSYDLLRRGGPPSPDWAGDWTVRLGTLLAEAAAQGMPAESIVAYCRAAVAEFAFPAE